MVTKGCPDTPEGSLILRTAVHPWFEPPVVLAFFHNQKNQAGVGVEGEVQVRVVVVGVGVVRLVHSQKRQVMVLVVVVLVVV